MGNKNRSDSELPSVTKLIKSTVLAIILAIIVLIIFVLPAEYGIDPTGFGKILGLTKMGEIKTSLAQEVAMEKSTAKNKSSKIITESVKKEVPPELEVKVKTDKMTISLKPNEGKEIKLKMRKGKVVSYVWWTNTGRLNYDAHADSKKHRIKYFNYSKGSTSRKEGTLEAFFDGKHGWFWRNRTKNTIILTLEVKGNYSSIKQEV